MRYLYYAPIVLLFISFAQAQEKDEDKRMNTNIATFTPSALFAKGQYEINLFNNIYTQAAIRDEDGDRIELPFRQTFLNTMLQFTYGVSRSSQVNVGLDLFINSATIDRESGTFLRHFFSDVEFREILVSYIAPRVKVVPLPKLFPRFSIQSSLWIPISSDLEDRQGNFVTHDRYTWLTQFFSDFSLGRKFQLFVAEDIFYRINRNSTNDRNFVRFILSAFINYFPNPRVTLFGSAQYAPRYETLSNDFDSQFGLSQWFTQIGGGAKYQVTPRLNLELSYSNLVASRRDGAGDVINFGIRFIN